MQTLRVSRAVTATIAVVLTGMVGLTVAGQQRSESKPTLKGVWRVTEWTTTGPGAAAGPNGVAHTNKSPQPWYGMFTDKHFTFLGVRGDSPSPDLASADKRTDKQVVDRYDLVVAQLGTYDARGGVLSIKTAVAINPNNMHPPGDTQTFTYSFDNGDSFSLISKTGTDGKPIAPPTTLKFLRVE